MAVAAVALVLSSCGGSSGSNDSQTSTSGSTTADADATPTTTSAEREASTQTEAATLTAADLGGEWGEYEGATTEVDDREAEACAAEDTEGTQDAAVASSSGEILQRGEASRFVRTDSYEFPDAESAAAYARWRLTDEAIECVRAGAAEVWNTETGRSVEAYGIDRPDQAPYLGSFSISYQIDVEGEQVTSSWATYFVHRKGAVVVVTLLEQAAAAGDPEDLGDQVLDETLAGIEAALARIEG